MEIEGLQCHGCGSTNVVFDPKRRVLTCYQCGKEEYYSRATLNANGKVAFARRNAIRFFAEGKLEDARHYAMDVLNISMDNAPAMYILAYYDEFAAGRSESLRQFFRQVQEVPLEFDEVKELRELFLTSAYHLADFEEEVIRLIAVNMQAEEDAEELCGFIDRICPYFIARRTSASFLTPELADMYRELAEHCGIPKTCFALLKAIDINPDSPCSDNSFFLKSKARYFYEHYIQQISEILSATRDPALRNKFLAAYQNKCASYRERAGIA